MLVFKNVPEDWSLSFYLIGLNKEMRKTVLLRESKDYVEAMEWAVTEDRCMSAGRKRLKRNTFNSNEGK